MLQRCEDTLRLILVYQTTTPLHPRHAFQFDLSQPPANSWLPQLLPVLPHAFAALGLAPERDASRLPTSPAMLEGAPEAALDGPARRRQRPPDAQVPKAHDRGKKKTHTAKNLLWVNERTSQVLSRGPTIAGRTPAKKAADAAPLASPTNATLDKETGVQG